MALEIKEGESAAAFARRVFRTVFEEDVHRLLSMVPARPLAPPHARPRTPTHPHIHPRTPTHLHARPRTVTHAHAPPPSPPPPRPGLVVEGACEARGAAAGGDDAARCRLPRRGRSARVEPRGERSGPPRRPRPPCPSLIPVDAHAMRVSRRVPCTRTRAHLSTVCTQVFLGAIETMHTERAQDFAKEGGGLEFDKDDPQALDLVTSASNLRSQVFHIPRKSRWEVKEIAGKIVPAIATTNAIIGGFIVLEALKVRARACLAPCRAPCRARAVRVVCACRAPCPPGACPHTRRCSAAMQAPMQAPMRVPMQVPMRVHYAHAQHALQAHAHAHAHRTPCTCMCRCCAARPPSAATWCATTTRSPGASATGCSTPPPSTCPTPSAASACRRCASWWTRPPSRWATSSMPSS